MSGFEEELGVAGGQVRGAAIRCLVIHGLYSSPPARRGKPRLVTCIYLFLLRRSSNKRSSLAPAKLPYLALVGPRCPGAGNPT